MKKKSIITLCIITIVAIGILTVTTYYHFKELKAVQLAKEYIKKEYDQEMEYRHVRFSWIDPSLYHVNFSPYNNPQILFEVKVQYNLAINETVQVGNNITHSANNYYSEYFSFLMTDFLNNDVKQLWGDNATLRVIEHNQGLYGFVLSNKLNDTIPINDMEPLIDYYWIYITTDKKLFEDQTIEQTASLIFEFIELLKNYGFTPNVLSYTFVPSSKDAPYYILFKKLDEIYTVDDVIDQINLSYNIYDYDFKKEGYK